MVYSFSHCLLSWHSTLLRPTTPRSVGEIAVQTLGPLLGAETQRTSVGALSWKKAQGPEGQLANLWLSQDRTTFLPWLYPFPHYLGRTAWLSKMFNRELVKIRTDKGRRGWNGKLTELEEGSWGACQSSGASSPTHRGKKLLFYQTWKELNLMQLFFGWGGW